MSTGNIPANPHGNTRLHVAASQGDVAAVRQLLATEDVNALNINDATPLFLAAREGHYEVVQLLLEAGADPTLSNKNVVTPQDIAARRNHREVAALINSYAVKRTYDRSSDVLSKILKKGPKHG